MPPHSAIRPGMSRRPPPRPASRGMSSSTRGCSANLSWARRPQGRVYGAAGVREDPSEVGPIADDLPLRARCRDAGRGSRTGPWWRVTYQVVPFDLHRSDRRAPGAECLAGRDRGPDGRPAAVRRPHAGDYQQLELELWRRGHAGSLAALPNPSQTLSFTPGLYSGSLTVSRSWQRPRRSPSRIGSTRSRHRSGTAR